MLRRRPSRERFGRVSFGRRVPRIDHEGIRGDLSALQKITVLSTVEEKKKGREKAAACIDILSFQ